MKSIYKSAMGREAVHALYRRALTQWPVPHADRLVPTCQGTMQSGGRQNTALLIEAAILLQCGVWGRRRALRLVSGSDQIPQEVAEFVLAIFSHFVRGRSGFRCRPTTHSPLSRCPCS